MIPFKAWSAGFSGVPSIYINLFANILDLSNNDFADLLCDLDFESLYLFLKFVYKINFLSLLLSSINSLTIYLEWEHGGGNFYGSLS